MSYKNFKHLKKRHVFTLLLAWLLMFDGLINKWLILFLIESFHHPSVIVDITVLHPQSGFLYIFIYLCKNIVFALAVIVSYEQLR